MRGLDFFMMICVIKLLHLKFFVDNMKLNFIYLHPQKQFLMKKLLFLAGLISSAFAFAQTTQFTLAYTFTSVTSGTACTGQVDPTPTPTVTGVTSGSFTAVGTSTCSSANGYFSFSGWGTGATNGNDTLFTGSLDPSKYFNITLTPQTNYVIEVDSIVFKSLRSATGPRFWAVRSSVDNYQTNLSAISTNSNISVTMNNEFKWTTDTYTSTTVQSGLKIMLGGSNFSNLTSPVSFRWYAWNAESTNGTFRLGYTYIYGSATVSTSVGKLTHDLQAHFILSPNPAGNVVELIPSNINEIEFVEIINTLGSVIYRTNKVDLSQKIYLNLDAIPAGLYFVKIGSAKNFYLEKLLITK